MYSSSSTNRAKADNDRSFKVEIVGFSRARWSLVMQKMHDLISDSDKVQDKEFTQALSQILEALQCQVVDNSDAYSICHSDISPQATELEMASLLNARSRRVEQLKAMRELARRVKRNQRKQQTAATTT